MDTRQEWLESRKRGIGGSEAATLMGLNPWDSPFALWSRKVGLVEDNEENEAMEWGRRLEGVVAEKFFDATEHVRVSDDDALAEIGCADVHFRKDGVLTLCHEDYTWMLATPDAFIRDTEGRLGILEVKTTRRDKLAEWQEGTPPYYYAQVQHYMAVTGTSYACFAVLFGGQKFMWCRVERDDGFISDLVQNVWAFWAKVTSEVQPDADDSIATEETLKRMYPKDDGETVELPDDADGWDDELLEVNAKIKELKEHKRALETRIKACIGGASYGTLPSGVQYSFKRVEVAARQQSGYSFRKLNRIDASD